MKYLLILILCGLPIAGHIFNKIDIWHAQGYWVQVGILLCFSYSLWRKPSGFYVRNKPLGLLTLWIGLSTAIVAYTGLLRNQYLVMNFLPFFNFLCLIIFYQICTQISAWDYRIILKCLAWVVVGTLIWCIVQAFGVDPFFSLLKGVPIMTEGKESVVVGFVGNFTHLSAYLGMMLPLLFMLRKRLAWSSVAVLFVIILFFVNYGQYTVPITGIITACVTFLYYMWKTNRKGFIIAVSILCISAGIYYFNLSEIARRALISSEGRLGEWTAYIPTIKKHFLFGQGLGAVNIASIVSGSPMNHSHCEYIQMLVEIGFVGLVAIGYCIYDTFRGKIDTHETVIMKAVLLGFLVQSATLFPAHLWLMITPVVFCYAGVYKHKEIA